MITSFWVFANQFSVTPFLPDIMMKRGYHEWQTGILFALFPFFSFLFSPFCGILLTYIGPEAAQVVGLVICSLATAIFGLFDHVWSFYCMRALQGASVALYQEGMYVCVSRLYPDEIPYRVGLLETSIGLGCSIGRVIGGWLFWLLGFSAPFISITVVLMTAAAAAALVLQPPIHRLACAFTQTNTDLQSQTILTLPFTQGSPALGVAKVRICEESSHKEEGEEIKVETHTWDSRVWLIPRVWMVGVMVMVAASTYTFFDPVLAPHLQREFGPVNDGVVGAIMSLQSVIYMIAALTTGAWASTHPKYPELASVGMLLCATGFVILGPAPFLVDTQLVLDHTRIAWVCQIGGQFLVAVGNAMSFVPALGWMQSYVAHMGPQAEELVLHITKIIFKYIFLH
eukprot:GHVR01054530.1.p1 GENE.GHVR01054530.1~~GHVR01054530.1.p1  ORF type:complete len:435 (+),score=92.38 GHVR01054530.1:110-1306(+)